MRTVHLTVELLIPSHPDYPLIWDWLTACGVDPAWVKMPSTVRVLKNAVVTQEYQHEQDGTLQRRPDDSPVLAEVRYEFTDAEMPVLPELTPGRVTNGA